MGRLYLVRHAEYKNPDNIYPGRLPVELSRRGRQQAVKLSAYFADKDITTIFSSPVRRCLQTAEIIAEATHSNVRSDLRLAEVFTAMQGAKASTATHMYDYWGYAEELGGETVRDVENRMVDFYESTPFENRKNYIICSHAGPLVILYKHLANKPPYNYHAKKEPEGYLDIAQIMKLEIDGHRLIADASIESPAAN